MSELFWLLDKQMRRIEPYFRCRTGCRTSMTVSNQASQSFLASNHSRFCQMTDLPVESRS